MTGVEQVARCMHVQVPCRDTVETPGGKESVFLRVVKRRASAMSISAARIIDAQALLLRAGFV